MKSKQLIGSGMLLAASLIWGTSFFVMKNTLDVVPVCGLLGIRFTVGFVLLSLIFAKRWRRIDRSQLCHGLICGVLLAGGYIVQTFGLTGTTPGKNAFLTAVYCVLTPFVAWLIFHRAPKARNWIAAVMCLTGIGLVSLDGDLSISSGDALTLVSGVFYAIHIVAVNHYSRKGDDAVLLTILQFGVTAVLAWGISLATETWRAAVPGDAWLALAYLAVMCTAVAMLFQNVGESMTTASSAAILLSLESVFGVLFSVIFAGEQVTARMLAGFAVIFAAVLVSEVPGKNSTTKPA